jgi:hypothetical protein
MAIGDITEARLNGDRFAESSLGHPAELWRRRWSQLLERPLQGIIFSAETLLAL